MFANLALVIYALSEIGWKYPDCYEAYQAPVVKLVAVLNLPAWTLAEITANLIFSPLKDYFSMQFATVFGMVYVTFFVILQWLLIGYLINLGYLASREKIK